MALRFIQSGDWHIDTSYHGGINPATGLDREWESNLAAVASSVDAAVQLNVAVYIIAGDMFRNGRPSAEAMLLLAETLRPLVEAGIPVIILRGNHELLLVSSTQRTATILLGEMLRGMSPKAEVHVVEREPMLVRTSTGAQVVCLPWLSKASVMNEIGSTGMDPTESDRLVVSEALRHIERLVDQADPGSPLLFTSHMTVDDVRLDTPEGAARRGAEVRMAHLFKEPIMPRKKLEEFGFAYGGLSHIHARQKLSDTFHYPGSTNRHTLDDVDREKSVNFVTVDDRGKTTVGYLPVAARPMVSLNLGSDGAEAAISALEAGSLVDLILEPGQHEADKKVISRLNAAGARIINTRAQITPVSPVAVAEALPEKISPMEALPKWLETRTDDVDRVVKVAGEIMGEDK